MLLSKKIISGLLAAILQLPLQASANYGGHALTEAFIDEMVAEENFDRAELETLFKKVEKKQSVIDAISRPAERTLTWSQYRNIFLQRSRIDGGVRFWLKNQETLRAAESRYGVPAEIIVSIMGVETRYGENTGNYRVMDALSTLAFDYPKRASFFRSELKHFLILAREQGREPLGLKGSYAGAMGLGQFMPSSYRAYAADHDQDGFIDIWANQSDAIWSVANYLARHGWTDGQPITSRARVSAEYSSDVMNQNLRPSLTLAQLAESGVTPELRGLSGDGLATAMMLEGAQGKEFWLGLHNFYVITRYNHSKLYAMAVFQLAEEIRNGYREQQEQNW